MKLIIAYLFAYLSRHVFCAFFDNQWWEEAAIYEVEVPAFKDHDGDGFGDLPGLKSKLGYIRELGFNAVKLSPIHSSIDIMSYDYGINDFRKIHTIIGTMQNFDELMEEAGSKDNESADVKVILDFIINDCSTSHEWFKKSQQRIDPYTDYFVWRDYTPEEKSMGATESSYWKWDAIRKQLFFHQRDDKADLNLRNEAVKQEIKEIMRFWFDKGVAGLNLIKPNRYIEDPLIMEKLYPSRKMRENYPESYEFIHELREFVDEYSKQTGDYQRILMVDRVSNSKYDNLRGNKSYPIAHIVSSNVFKEVFHRSSSPFDLFHKDEITYNSNQNLNLIQYMTEELKNGPSMFMSESAESIKRLGSIFQDQQLLNTWIMSMSMCPGIFHVLYGQEIGLDSFHSWHHHFYHNYPYGSSMSWDDSMNAGFTSSTFSLVPPNISYWRRNVEKYKTDQFSTLHMMEDLMELRKTNAIKRGDLQTYNMTEFVFAFTRSYENKESYLIIFNLSNLVHSITLNTILENIPDRAQVAASTPNASPQKGSEVVTRLPLPLRPESGMVLDVTNKMEQ